MPHFKKNTQMKTTRFRTLFICLLLLLCRPLSAGTLDTFFAYLEQHTLQSEFTITVSEEVAQPMNYPGEITMLGRQFLLTMFDTEAAYDGQTLSVYSASTDELTLSTPTEAELLEANPFLYAQALVKVCTITEHPSKDRTQTIITLTPNDQTAGIQRFTLRLKTSETTQNTQTTSKAKTTESTTVFLPLSVEIKEGKKLTTLTLKQPHYLPTPPRFCLDHPDAYQNDLR